MKITKKTAVICSVDDPTPIAYLNVYEKGDIWVKTQGCDKCPIKNRLKCCGTCSMLLKDTGECRLHMGNDKRQKPFYCIVKPYPNTGWSHCSLEFKCIKGTYKGKIRKINKAGNVFN